MDKENELNFYRKNHQYNIPYRLMYLCNVYPTITWHDACEIYKNAVDIVLKEHNADNLINARFGGLGILEVEYVFRLLLEEYEKRGCKMAKENCIEWVTGDKFATVTFSQKKFINRLLRLKKKNPQEVSILKTPKNNDGYAVAKIPIDSLKLYLIRKEYTEEERAELLSRLKVKKNDSIQVTKNKE